jgi:2-polyprenyl-3-methyl-5-hydroxy-6-metoxy-1,4-benzoquinol methylase
MTPCPICGSEAEVSHRAIDENHRVSSQVFDYATCRACRTVFLTNPPDDLGRYYEADYYHIPALDRLSKLASKDPNKIEIVDRFANGKQLLEIGPAFGVFAFQAKQNGYDVDVVEMDERCCTYLRDTVGVGVTQSDAPDKAITGLPAHDVIALWHVLEHLHAIPAVIEAAAANLKPGGILVIATPNPDAAQFGLMRSHWPHLDAPRHLALIPMQTLKELGTKARLEMAFVTTDDSDARSWNRFGWQRLLMNRFRSRTMQRAMFVVGYGMAILASPFDRRANRGSAYTMVLRKRPA